MSPVLVGAVTVLVIIVAVFLAYNANNGLPFVSTYDLKARVSDADALVKANEVRIGGARVGVVKSVVPVQLKNGGQVAEMTLSLDKSAEPIPNDSTILVRPKSPLGLKYLQITPGSSTTGYKAGETIPVRFAKPEPGDIDKFFDMFNEPTRKAIRGVASSPATEANISAAVVRPAPSPPAPCSAACIGTTASRR